MDASGEGPVPMQGLSAGPSAEGSLEVADPFDHEAIAFGVNRGVPIEMHGRGGRCIRSMHGEHG